MWLTGKWLLCVRTCLQFFNLFKLPSRDYQSFVALRWYLNYFHACANLKAKCTFMALCLPVPRGQGARAFIFNNPSKRRNRLFIMRGPYLGVRCVQCAWMRTVGYFFFLLVQRLLSRFVSRTMVVLVLVVRGIRVYIYACLTTFIHSLWPVILHPSTCTCGMITVRTV